jgi:hypothetical protein
MAPGVGRRIVDRDIDLDKLRAAIGCSGKANDFHQGALRMARRAALV